MATMYLCNDLRLALAQYAAGSMTTKSVTGMNFRLQFATANPGDTGTNGAFTQSAAALEYAFGAISKPGGNPSAIITNDTTCTVTNTSGSQRTCTWAVFRNTSAGEYLLRTELSSTVVLEHNEGFDLDPSTFQVALSGIGQDLAEEILQYFQKQSSWSAPSGCYATIHTADPGVTGANEGPASRVDISSVMSVVSYAAKNTGGIVQVLNNSGSLISGSDLHMGFWSALAGGNFITSVPIGGANLKPYADYGTIYIPAGGYVEFNTNELILQF